MENKLTRKERDYIRHKTEIMNSAEELFAEEGYYNITMEMIAKKAEYSKGTLYNYFESKEILFFEILNDKTELFKVGLDKVVKESTEIVDKLNAFIEFYLDFFTKNIDFFKIAQTEKYNLTIFTQKKMMSSLRKKYFNHLKRINSIIKLDKRKSEEESKLLALAISGMLNGLIAQNFIDDEKSDIERVKEFAKNKILKIID